MISVNSMSVVCTPIEEKTYERLAFNAIFRNTCVGGVFISAKRLLLVAGAALVAWWMGVMLQFLVLLSLYSIVISLYVCCVTAYCMSKRLVNSMLVSLSNREIMKRGIRIIPARCFVLPRLIEMNFADKNGSSK